LEREGLSVLLPSWAATGGPEGSAVLHPWRPGFRLENTYVQENLRDGVDKLSAAYQRARKRRVEPTRDEKLRRQLRSAGESIAEGGRALRSGRRKPERRWGPRVARGRRARLGRAAAAVWANQRLTGEPSGPEQEVPKPAENLADAVPEPATA
jgi:hypothetical protein